MRWLSQLRWRKIIAQVKQTTQQQQIFFKVTIGQTTTKGNTTQGTGTTWATTRRIGTTRISRRKRFLATAWK